MKSLVTRGRGVCVRGQMGGALTGTIPDGSTIRALIWSLIIENVLKPNGLTLNGTMRWHGNVRGDMGKIVVKDNIVTVYFATDIIWVSREEHERINAE